MTAFNLAQLSDAIAADIAGGGPTDLSFAVARLIDSSPGAALDLIEHILRDGAGHTRPQGKRRKAVRLEPDDGLMAAQAYLLAHALEVLRFDVELNKADALARAEQLRARLLKAGREEGAGAALMIFILHQFVAAKLDMGDELRSLMHSLMEAEASAMAARMPMDGLDADFVQLAKDLDGDPFAIHAMLAETALILPDEMRAPMVANAFAQGMPELCEAGLGWLLDDSGPVRRTLMQALGKASGQGRVSGVMLRRMIAVRNWLPEEDRPHLDRVIKAARQKKVVCASWPKAKVLEAYVSGFDGVGAQSVILLAGEGRKRCFAGLLFKHGAGIRDAWVQHQLSPNEGNMMLESVASQMHLTPAGLDYVAAATRHFLAVNAQSKIMPPFSLLDFAEIAGLSEVNPERLPLEDLVESLCAGIAPEQAGPDAVANALVTSAAWRERQPIVDCWFEDGDEIAALLAPRKLSKAKRHAALLAMPLQKRRRWWAELVAWTAYNIKCDPNSSGWEAFVLVARELLGERPLGEIGIMNQIAATTLEVHSGR